MGKIESGAFSSISGKVGNLVGSTWKNINYLKAKPKKSSKPATPQQVEQRLRFRIVSKFVSLLTPLLHITNKGRALDRITNNVSFAEIISNNLTRVNNALHDRYCKGSGEKSHFHKLS